MNQYYAAVAERAGWRCEYCRAPERVFNFAFEVEHIQPRTAGGDESPGNLALSCESCNRYKSTSVVGLDAIEGRETLLFHPRRDHWDDHFKLLSATGELQGLTSTGRVTIAVLKMNSAFQLRARRHWALLGLYP